MVNFIKKGELCKSFFFTMNLLFSMSSLYSLSLDDLVGV